MFKHFCTIKVIFVFTILTILLFGGILFLTFWGMPRIIKAQLHKQTELETGTDQWDRFLELPFPVSFSIRFFEVNNTEDVINKNAKPMLQETLPYTYNMNIKKDQLRFDDDEEDSITYIRNISFDFVENGLTSELDEVTIVNPLLMSSLQLTNDVERLALAGCLKKILTPDQLGTLFIRFPVRKMLFDGLNFAFANNSNLGVACRIVRNKMLELVQNIRNIEHVPGEDEGNDYLRFSIFNYKTQNYLKGTPDGIYTVNRGRNDMEELGNIMRWNGNTTLNIWGTIFSINNDSCNAVRGTDSTIYNPLLEENDNLFIFNTDICRSVKLIYKNSNETYKGIKAFRYETDPSLFRPSTTNAVNDCFCTKSTKDVQGQENCYLDGVFDFKPCIGSPILVSLPHFLDADAKYGDNFEGLSPDKSLHDIYLLLEPNTGTPLVGRKRIQLNSVFKQESLISFITPETMTEAVFPILWLEESVDLPQKYVDLLNKQYFGVVKLANGLMYGFIAAIAVILTILMFFLFRKLYLKTKKPTA